MLWIAIVVAVLLSLAAAAYVAWPLVRAEPPPVVVEDDRLSDLIGRKDAVLTAIKDLEFDYQVGKLSEEDYERFNQRLRRQAIGLIQQIEQVAPESAKLDAQLEAEITRRRKTHEPAAAPVPARPQPTALTGAVAMATPPATVAEAHYCTQCGQQLAPTHKFCANCGTPVAAPATASAPS
jgi:hypothetical protein